MKDYERIANLVISLTETDIFENRKTQKHVYSRAFFDYIMRKVKNKTYQSIANFYKSKNKPTNHATVYYRINLFHEIKQRRPEFNTWQRIIEQTSLTDIKSIEKVVDILDVLRDQELEQKESFLKTI